MTWNNLLTQVKHGLQNLFISTDNDYEREYNINNEKDLDEIIRFIDKYEKEMKLAENNMNERLPYWVCKF